MFPDKRVCGRVCGRPDPNRKTAPADTRSPGSVKGSARAVSLRSRDPPLARCRKMQTSGQPASPDAYRTERVPILSGTTPG